MTCKECKYGKYNKKTDTVHCRLLDRTLIVNRADSCKEHNLKADIKKHREKMKYNGLSVGDTMKCANKEDLLNTHNDLAENGIQTDFMYEKDGVKGLWLEVMKIEK